MPRATPIQSSLNAGEFSPRMEARTVFSKYPLACATLENMVPLPQGGAMRRPGTVFVTEAKDSAKRIRLLPFQFSTKQAYVIEAGDGYFRFYRNRGRIVAGDTDAAIVNGTFDTDFNAPFSHVWQVDDTPADTAFVDETADANSAADNDWQLFPTSEAAGDYAAFGFTAAFEQIRFDYANGVAGVGGVVAWEYWNGAAWTALADVTDETAGFTAAAADNLTVSWTVPVDWAARAISTSASLFWVRARVTTAYTTNPVMDQGFILRDWLDRSTGTASIAYEAAENRLDLVGAAASVAGAEQAVAIGVAHQATEHVLRFRVHGAPGDKVAMRIGTTSTGTEITADIDYETGFHTVSFTPNTGLIYVQFRNEAEKTLGIDDVSFVVDAPVELTTPYTEAQLAALKFAQSADTLYICHGAHPVYKLLRFSDTAWSLERANFLDGPYLDENPTTTTLTPSAVTGPGITITASATTGINDGKGFLATDVGRPLRIKHGVVWGYAVITGVTSTTEAIADVRRDFGAATAQEAWRLGEWSGTTGYPLAVSFFEQRLGFAATDIKPQTFWLSQAADIESFEPDSVPSGGGERQIEDDDALNFTIAADQVNAIRWVSPGAKLVLGTVGGEWLVSSNGPAITPTDIDVKRQTAFGSADIQPVIMRGRLVFLQRAARKLLEFTFSFELDNFRALDQTLLADHVTKGGITDIAYQQELDSTLWCVRADGQMPTLTFQPDQAVVGWARQIIGGGFVGGNAVAESVAVIPGVNQDEIWFVVKRTIGGVTRRYIEYLHAIFETGDDQESAHFADSGLTLDDPKTITGASQTNPATVTAPGHGFADGDGVRITNVVGMTALNGNSYTVANAGANTFDLLDSNGVNVDGTGFAAYASGGAARKKVTAVSGLDHLEGETVAILADGAVHPKKTVSAGLVTLDYPASRVTAGLPYTHKYKSLKWEAGSATGTAQGQIKRIDGVTLVLLDSASVLVGPSEDRLKPVSFRESDDLMDAAVPLFTGEKFVEFDGDYETDTRVHIQGDHPAPFFLLAVAPSMKTNNR